MLLSMPVSWSLVIRLINEEKSILPLDAAPFSSTLDSLVFIVPDGGLTSRKRGLQKNYNLSVVQKDT